MKSQILKVLKDALRLNLENQNEFLLIRSMLVKHIGKPINEDIQLSPGFTIRRYDKGYCIVSPRNVEHHVCNFDECANFTIDQFDILDVRNNTIAESMADRLQALIDNPVELIKVFSRLVRAKVDLHAAVIALKDNTDLSVNNPAYNSLLDLFEIKEGFINRVYDNRFN